MRYLIILLLLAFASCEYNDIPRETIELENPYQKASLVFQVNGYGEVNVLTDELIYSNTFQGSERISLYLEDCDNIKIEYIGSVIVRDIDIINLYR